jgi:hypothetical protein
MRIVSLIHGDCLQVHCPIESCGLAFLNPPFDDEFGQSANRRFDVLFLPHFARWLEPAARVLELAEGGYIERSEPVVLIDSAVLARATWQPGCVWRPAGKNVVLELPRLQRLSTNWWGPNRMAGFAG